MASISGIYVIINTRNGKIYLGQAQNIRKRWNKHRSELNANKHHNRHLQRAWNKHGANVFQFEILEYCSADQLDVREQHFIDIYKTKGICYNIADNVKATMRGKKFSFAHRRKMSIAATGRKHTAETRQKISEASLARSLKTLEHRRNQSLGQMGRVFTAETRRKIGDANSESFVVTSPDGTEFEVIGLSQFCRDNHLSTANMSAIAHGKRKTHKGWKCRKLI